LFRPKSFFIRVFHNFITCAVFFDDAGPPFTQVRACRHNFVVYNNTCVSILSVVNVLNPLTANRTQDVGDAQKAVRPVRCGRSLTVLVVHKCVRARARHRFLNTECYRRSVLYFLLFQRPADSSSYDIFVWVFEISRKYRRRILSGYRFTHGLLV